MYQNDGYFLAEDEGFEPPQTESESGVLPLHKSSIWNGFIIRNFSEKSSPIFYFLPDFSGSAEIPRYDSALYQGMFSPANTRFR